MKQSIKERQTQDADQSSTSLEPKANKNPATETFHEVINEYNKMTLEDVTKVKLSLAKAKNAANYGSVMTRNSTTKPTSGKIAKSVQHK